MKFVDIKNDVAFRKIFGNEKKSICLISFLNAVLELKGSDRVAKVTIINPYLLPRIAGEKSSIIDVRATDQKGRQFVVEMQVADKTGFDKRVQYYTAKDYSMQSKDELMTYISAGMREADTEQELLKAKENGEMEGKIKAIVRVLRRGKLTIEEIAEDFETDIPFVIKIKNEYSL